MLGPGSRICVIVDLPKLDFRHLVDEDIAGVALWRFALLLCEIGVERLHGSKIIAFILRGDCESVITLRLGKALQVLNGVLACPAVDLFPVTLTTHVQVFMFLPFTS